MSGSVVQIFVCPEKGQPMEEVTEVRASMEAGLEGDRYGSSQSTPDRQVSLIAFEAIEAANEGLPEPFLPIETRRNLITHGVDLNGLVDKEFSIGEVRLRGTRLCNPCERPALLAGRGVEERKLFPVVFDNRGGLRAEVVVAGLIRVGNSIVHH